MGKSGVGICRAQRGGGGRGRLRVQRNSFFEENRRGARGLKQREVPPIGEERDLPRFGMFDAGDSANLDFRRAFQAATQFLRDIGKSHGKAPELFGEADCESRTGQRGSTAGPWSLLVEKARLRRWCRS